MAEFNKQILYTLEDRFDHLYYAISKMDHSQDLYVVIASVMYDKPYLDCCEIVPNTYTYNPKAKDWRNRAKQFIISIIVTCGNSLYASEDSLEYNPELLSVLKYRFDKVQSYLDRVYVPGEDDLYSFIASIIYDKDYSECREISPDGMPNYEGKYFRNMVKQFLVPVIAECGGITVGEDAE